MKKDTPPLNPYQKYALWRWLWMWERQAAGHHRISIKHVPQFYLFVVRVDNTHGIPSGLQEELKNASFTFEYYYAYSRGDIWGGFRSFHNKQCFSNHLYGLLKVKEKKKKKRKSLSPPPILWKNLIWIRQIEMELEQSKGGGTYATYANSNANNNKEHPLFDNEWYRGHRSTPNGSVRSFFIFTQMHALLFFCIEMTMNPIDLSKMFGVRVEMLCGQCGQSNAMCRSLDVCPCFKGYFPFKDLYDRHKCLVMDYRVEHILW